MEVKNEVMIRNYNLDKKEYELGRQKLIALSRKDLFSLLNELPVVDHYVKIEIKTVNINIIKVGPNHYSYKLYHRNILLTESKNVEFQLILEVINNLGIFNKSVASHKRKLSEIKFTKYKIYKYFINLMTIILGSLLPLTLIYIYIGMILIKEFNFYEHLYFLFTIAISFYLVGSFIITFVNKIRKRVIDYETPYIGEFTSYDASLHMVQLTLSIGFGYYIISLLPLLSFENIIGTIVIILLVNFPNLSDLSKKYTKNKRKKFEVLLFLSKYLQLNANSSFEEKYIFSSLMIIDNKKILGFTLSNKIVSFLVLMLSILSPLF